MGWLLVLVATGVACQSPAPPSRGDLVFGPTGRARWIETDPQVVVGRDHFVRESETFAWDLRQVRETRQWITRPAVEARTDPEMGMVLLAGDGAPAARRKVELDTRAVALIEVEARGGGHALELAWAPPGKRFDQQRMLEVPRSTTDPEATSTYRFAVGAHQSWRGRVATIRLRAIGSGPRLVVARMVGRSRLLRADALDEARDQAWKVELGHEVRNAFLTQPGVDIERTATIPNGGRLRFALALEDTVRDPVTFRVRVLPADPSDRPTPPTRDPADDAEADDAEGTVVFERRQGARVSGTSPTWRDAEISLDRWAGQRVRLRLETVADPAFDPDHGFAYWGHPELLARTGERPPSVLLISVDTLRADRLSGYGYDRSTTPRLDAWAARRAVTFRNVVAAAPWTLPSHVSIFTGLDAIHHGINHDVAGLDSNGLEAPHTKLDTLAERLRNAGYATGAYTGGAYLHPQYGFAQGFDAYGYWPDRSQDRQEFSTGIARAQAWLQQHRDEPSFFFLHTYEVHDPYRTHQPEWDRVMPSLEPPPEGFRVALHSPTPDPERGFRQANQHILRHATGSDEPATEDDLALINALYDSGVAAMDTKLGAFLAALEEQKLDESLLVVVTSDHGEALGEHGRVGHVDLYDVGLKVPLIMAWPKADNRYAGATVTEQVRSIDIAPTILAWLAQTPAADADGVSLLPLLEGDRGHVPPEAWSYAASSNRGVSLRYGNRLKWILPNSAWPPSGTPELYDLSVDPGEGDNRFARMPAGRAAALTAEAQAHLRRAPGLELTIRNREATTLRGTFEGAMVRPVATKTPDRDCDCVSWTAMGEATFEVPPDSGLTLRFEKVFGRRLSVRGTLDDARRGHFDHTFDVRDLEDTAFLRYTDARWDTGGGSEVPTGTGFTVRWRGGPTATEEPDAVTGELREQLEALGYIQ